MLLPRYCFFFVLLFLCGRRFRLLSSVLWNSKKNCVLTCARAEFLWPDLTFNPALCPLVFPSMCGHTLLSISRPGAFRHSCYLLPHPPPSNTPGRPPPCHYLFRPREADGAGAERAAVGVILPAAALRAKIFVTRSPVAPPSSVRPSCFVFPLAPFHDLLFGCCPKRDEKGRSSSFCQIGRYSSF